MRCTQRIYSQRVMDATLPGHGCHPRRGEKGTTNSRTRSAAHHFPRGLFLAPTEGHERDSHMTRRTDSLFVAALVRGAAQALPRHPTRSSGDRAEVNARMPWHRFVPIACLASLAWAGCSGPDPVPPPAVSAVRPWGRARLGEVELVSSGESFGVAVEGEGSAERELLISVDYRIQPERRLAPVEQQISLQVALMDGARRACTLAPELGSLVAGCCHWESGRLVYRVETRPAEVEAVVLQVHGSRVTLPLPSTTAVPR